MPDIGVTLREARMRASIDITEIETETKIRAKYLRALENEEWDLLPGPTYVKSFLRTYAEALDLDAKLLVEEYKLRHEHLSDVELQPISPRPGRERRRGTPTVPRGVVIGAIVVGLVVALALLGRQNDAADAPLPPASDAPSTQTEAAAAEEEGDDGEEAGGSSESEGESQAEAERRREREEREARVVSLQVVPTGDVYVCLFAAGARRLIDGEVLAAGQESDTFRSSRFRINLGNGNATLRINGRTVEVPDSANGSGFDIRRGERAPIPDGERPCQ
jgi:cytoskeletal protein RodZ